jgi:type III secretion system FlhB-like substrate exporter
VKRYGKYGEKANRIVKRHEKYGIKVGKSEMIWKMWKKSKLKCEII